MRILTGFFPPTSGRAMIGGLDVAEHSLETRRRVGYLPENMVLYPDLSVDALLEFAARVREIDAKTARDRIEFSLDTCGLKDVRRKLIGKLSKGYRQRVGIAQAILSDPEVLILDEPTVGLDPRQVAETRSLIAKLGKQRTVLFSSHLLAEVATLCRRVVVIDRGRVAAIREVGELSRTAGQRRLELRISGDPATAARLIAGLPGVNTAVVRAGSVVIHGSGDDLAQRVSAAVVSNGFGLIELRADDADLEDAYLRLTGE
jgi:ABC-2 type transport system ATP-binding protein